MSIGTGIACSTGIPACDPMKHLLRLGKLYFAHCLSFAVKAAYSKSTEHEKALNFELKELVLSVLVQRQNPAFSACSALLTGGLAHLVERLICIQKVRSSTLLTSINFPSIMRL